MSEEDQDFLNRIEESFRRMYESSESRIDRTNEMVCKLAEAIHDIAVESKNTAQMYSTAMQSYDKHLLELQNRCNKMQNMVEEAQKLHMKLIENLAQQEKTMQALIASIGRVNVNNYKFDNITE